ncbi:MAG: acyl-CoA dehydrogenase family protein [Acidimicrobiales bacterium]
MDFDLSDDQVALRDAASALLDQPRWAERLRSRVGPGTMVGRRSESAASGFDEMLWSAMGEQGWSAVERPVPDGLGLGMVEVAVLCQQIGRRVAAVPFLPSVLALDALSSALPSAAGDDAKVAGWVASLSCGDAVGCVVWSARPGAVEVSWSDGRPLLSGRSDPVLYGPSASVAVVATDEGLYAVDPDHGGRAGPVGAMDRTRELGWLELDQTPGILLGGPPAVARLLDRAATGAAAEMLGAAERVLEMTVDYAKDRVQFGRPIGSFQAVKHRLADALVDVEGMRSAVYYAAWCTATDDPDAALAASMAKAWCSDASRRVMASGLQLHGGIGFTWEHDLHLYLKRSQLDQISFGDAGWHRDRIAGILRTRLAADPGQPNGTR